MSMRRFGAVLFLIASSCGGSDGPGPLDVNWTFAAGDCAANGVESVRITCAANGGASQSKTFPCSAGRGSLGSVGNGTYSIKAEGLDGSGTARASNYPTTLTISGSGGIGSDLDVTLHPAPGDVVVTWKLTSGRACPDGVVMPFAVTLYKALPDGSRGVSVDEAEPSCEFGKTIFPDVAPGDYVVVLDSRAVQPAIKLVGTVTVKAGETAQVSLSAR
jgi:hypothetical protein